MRQLSLVNSDLKVEVADEHFSLVNAYNWYHDLDTDFAFRILSDGEIEFLHNFISRRIAHWE